MQTTRGTPLSDPADSAVRRPRRHTIALAAAVAATSYALDQATKWWAEQALTQGQSQRVLGDWLQFTLSYNAGAAFSTGTQYTVVLTLIALAVICVCLVMARRLGSVGWALALGLVLGGSLGNVTDRLFRPPSPFRGHVVDFLQIPHWPIFNIADSSISIAAVLFIILSVRGVRLDGTVEQRVDPPPRSGSPGVE
jgi:signal peptidase II